MNTLTGCFMPFRRGVALWVAPWLALALVASAARAVSLPDDFVDDPLVTGLDLPTSMAFLPDGRLLITEQFSGKIRMVVNGQIGSTDPIYTVTSLSVSYEQGLEGIAVDKAWPAKPYVYICYTRSDNTIRLERYTASGDLSNPSSGNLSLASPLVLIGDIPDLNPVHNAGCVRTTPGYLFVGLGDDMNRCLAQDSTSLHGAILRLRTDALPASGGSQVPRGLLIPPGNPYAASPDSDAKLVWAYGLRNPFRFLIDSATGKIHVADVGEDVAEEIDEIGAAGGGNYGWPYREANHVMTPPDCSEPGGAGTGRYVAPIAAFDHSSVDDTHGGLVITVTGVYHPATGGTNNWPVMYYGDLFYGEYFNGFLRRLHFNGFSWGPGTVAPGQPTGTEWATGMPSQVEFQVGPDGSLWWLAQGTSSYPINNDGVLHRIRYGPNIVPPPPPQPLAGLRCTPNPFEITSDISFEMAAPSRVHLGVYDLNGRRVRHLLDGDTPALDSNGFAHVTWNGVDDHGRRVRSGLYLVRLEHDGLESKARIALVK